MKKIFQLTSILAVLSLVVLSCANEKLSTDQYDSAVVALKAYGPQPVVRGGYLRFVGSNLDKVATVTIPGVDPIVPEVVTPGVHSEIRVTVPKDGPMPGYPVLTLADGTTITAKTAISYSEPITVEGFTPAKAFPGDEITIKGDYLNLIHEVVFTDNVKVSETFFTAHDRYTIKVRVPEQAKTGKLGLGTVDEANTEDKDLLESLNMVMTESELEVGTAKATFPSTPIKSGKPVKISGSHLLLVEEILLGSYALDEFGATDTEINFDLPYTAPDGEVKLVMASGVEVLIGTLTTVVASELSVSPAPVKNGALLTISGKDLDIVDNIVVGGAAISDFERNEEGTKILLEVPAEAVDGDVLLIMINRKETSVPFTLVKPVFTAFSENPAAAGSDLEITGTDLDLVASVTFGVTEESEGLTVTEGLVITETSVTVPVPTAAETGIVVLNLVNGTTVECAELAIDKPAGAFIANMPSDLYSPGDMFIVALENADLLTGVQFDGEDVTYILNKGVLYVQIPSSATANTTITLISESGSVTYPMNIDPGDFIVTPIWTGSKDIDWGGTFGEDGKSLAIFAYGAYDWSSVKEGMILRVEFTPNVPDGDWFCVALRHGDSWGNIADLPGQFDMPACPFEIELTREILDDLIANSGLIITGGNYNLTQVSLVEDLRYGEAVWRGAMDVDWGGAFGEDGKAMKALAYGGFDWSSVKAGSTLYIHYNITAEPEAWWCIALRHGDGWGNIADLPGQYDVPGESPFGLKLTQEIIDDLAANSGLIVSGTGYQVTKVSIK